MIVKSDNYTGVKYIESFAFNGIGGILLPTVCMLFDPFVFRPPVGSQYKISTIEGLYRFQTFAYAGFAIAIITFVIWLIYGHQLSYSSGLIAGILYVTGVTAFVIGIVLLPYSFPGLFLYCLGLLGFTPFLMAFIYIRQGWLAHRRVKQYFESGLSLVSVGLGALLILSVSIGAQLYVTYVI